MKGTLEECMDKAEWNYTKRPYKNTYAYTPYCCGQPVHCEGYLTTPYMKCFECGKKIVNSYKGYWIYGYGGE